MHRGRRKTVRAWAAYRYGYLLVDTIRHTKRVATGAARALWWNEVEAGMHTPEGLLSEHGVTIERVTIAAGWVTQRARRLDGPR